MSNIYTWSTTSADNDDADSGINWLELQDPDTVNNSARVMMARQAAFVRDVMPTRSSTGSSNAYAVTAAAAPTTLSTDFVVWFKADRTNTGASTLTVNSLASKPLRAKASTALVAGEIQANTIVGAYYSLATDEYLIINSGFHASTLFPSLVTSYAVGLRAGMSIDWWGSSLPTGWLWCDGSAVSRTTYAELFSAIGTTYGTGDGSTTFNVPDARGRATFGKDNMGGTAANRVTSTTSITGTTLGASGGAQTVTITQANLPAVDLSGNTSTDGAHSHTYGDFGNGAYGSGNSESGPQGNITSNTGSAGSHSHTVTVALGGSGTALNKMPPALICNKIILANPTTASGGDVIPEYTVAGLPSSGTNIAIATNGRKNGEGSGLGTGVMCFRVSTTWYAVDTGAEVAA